MPSIRLYFSGISAHWLLYSLRHTNHSQGWIKHLESNLQPLMTGALEVTT